MTLVAFFIYLFDQQSEYTAFHKLMCWQESNLRTFWRGEIPSNEGVSYISSLRVNLFSRSETHSVAWSLFWRSWN